MEKSDKEYFEELLAKVPDDVARLVDRQMEISVSIADAIDRSKYKNRKEFAKAIGMKPSMLSRILAGNVNLTLKTITKIEAALKTDIISIGVPESVQEEQFVVPPELITRDSFFESLKPMILYSIQDNVKQSSEIVDIISKSGYYDSEVRIYGRA